MRCGRCGNDNADSNRFCGMCGAALLPQTGSPVNSAASSPSARVDAPRPASVPARAAQSESRQYSEAPWPTTPNPPSSRPLQSFSPREAEPGPEPGITGPSFLGLSRPGPVYDRGSSHDRLPSSSGSLDYLLDEEDEPKRGSGKLILFLLALALAGGFGYLHWKQGGFEWLNGGKKPAATAPDATQNTDSHSASTPETSAPASNGATPPANSAASTPAETTSPQATQNPAAPAASNPTPQTPNNAAENAAPQNSATAPASQDAAQNKPGDSSAAPIADSQTAGSDSEPAPAAETPAPKAKSRKPAAAKPTPAKAYNSVSEAERYIYGRGVSQDCDRGLRLLKPAAEQSNTQAMISMGSLYTTGTCTPRDLRNCLSLVRSRAAPATRQSGSAR